MNADRRINLDKLRYRLLEENDWPKAYMFKFIVPNQDGKVDRVKSLMPAQGALSFKHTKNLKFVSITCVATMASADAVIDVTEQAMLVGGVIPL